MERISCIGKADEMTSFDSPVLFFPVRHHSPVCSFQLNRVIDIYKPDIIMTEGPEDANELKNGTKYERGK